VSTKRIFLPICTPELDMPALEAGVVVARKFDAHLEGTHIQASDAPSAEFATSHLDPRHYTEVVNRLQKQKRQDAIATRQAFEEFVTSRNLTLSSEPIGTTVATASWEELTGDPGEVVAVRGGTTNHWNGWCRPLDDLDMREREWVPLSGWPIERSEIGELGARRFFRGAQGTPVLTAGERWGQPSDRFSFGSFSLARQRK